MKRIVKVVFFLLSAGAFAGLSLYGQEYTEESLRKIMENPAFQRLQLAVGQDEQADERIPLYLVVPAEVVLRYLLLKEVATYLEQEKSRIKVNNIDSLIAYVAWSLKKPIELAFAPEYLFNPSAKKLDLILKRPFLDFNIESIGWHSLSGYLNAQVTEKAANYVRQFIKNNNYDKNIVVRLMPNKTMAGRYLKVYLNNKERTLGETLRDGALAKDLARGYAELPFKENVPYGEFDHEVIVHSVRNSFESNFDPAQKLREEAERIGRAVIEKSRQAPVPVSRTNELNSSTDQAADSKLFSLDFFARLKQKFLGSASKSSDSPSKELEGSRKSISSSATTGALLPPPPPQAAPPKVSSAEVKSQPSSLLGEIKKGTVLKKVELDLPRRREGVASVAAQVLGRNIKVKDEEEVQEEDNGEWEEEEPVKRSQPAQIRQEQASPKKELSAVISPVENKPAEKVPEQQKATSPSKQQSKDLSSLLSQGLASRRKAIVGEEEKDEW